MGVVTTVLGAKVWASAARVNTPNAAMESVGMSSDLPENVVLRDAAEDDTNFIFSSWLKSYKKSAGPIPYRWYFKIFQKVLERLFHRPAIQTRVACFRTNDSQIFGYIVFERHPEQGNFCHYIYVKDLFRNMNIGSALVEDAFSGEDFTYTFRPRRAKFFVDRGGHFNDRYVRGDLED